MIFTQVKFQAIISSFMSFTKQADHDFPDDENGVVCITVHPEYSVLSEGFLLENLPEVQKKERKFQN